MLKSKWNSIKKRVKEENKSQLRLFQLSHLERTNKTILNLIAFKAFVINQKSKHTHKFQIIECLKTYLGTPK